jgi:hypothetical protein
MNSLADLYPAAIGRQHPYGNLQPLPRLVDDRHRAISPLRPAQDLNGGPIERMKRIEDLDLSVFRTQGIVGVGVIIPMSTACSPPAALLRTTPAGSSPAAPFSPSRSSAACSAARAQKVKASRNALLIPNEMNRFLNSHSDSRIRPDKREVFLR